MCLSPLVLPDRPWAQAVVRCGQCKLCRIRRKQIWVGRLRLELMDHESARFLTLTYREAPDEHVISDLQGFAKRYRYHYGKSRYFAVGEHGDKSGRCHWHIIVFGHPPETTPEDRYNRSERMALCWPSGFILDGDVNEKSIGYVAGYCLKKNKDKPVATRMSLKPGLGFERLEMLGYQTGLRHPVLDVWPGRYRIGDRKYPFGENGLEAYKKGYLKAGGRPPVDPAPVEQQIAAVSWFERGTSFEARERARRDYFTQKGIEHELPKEVITRPRV